MYVFNFKCIHQNEGRYINYMGCQTSFYDEFLREMLRFAYNARYTHIYSIVLSR